MTGTFIPHTQVAMTPPTNYVYSLPVVSAILDMKIQRDKIKQYRKKIQAVLNREHEIAIECLRKGDKSRAKLALRRKKYQEQLLEKADKQLETLEELVCSYEHRYNRQPLTL